MLGWFAAKQAVVPYGLPCRYSAECGPQNLGPQKLPPRSVEKTSALPVAFSLETKPFACALAFKVVRNAPGVVGKLEESAAPATNALPRLSTAIEPMMMDPPPPTYVE